MIAVAILLYIKSATSVVFKMASNVLEDIHPINKIDQDEYLKPIFMALSQWSQISFLVLIILSFTISGCSEDNPKPGCFQEQGRSIIATITNAEGTIRAPDTFCPGDFTIEPNDKVDSRPLGAFFPCNLESEFQVEDIRVIFSGFVYESFDTENICADFFEITEIRRIDQ